MTDRNSNTQNPWAEFEMPWSGQNYKKWMSKHWPEFFLHPSEIVERSIPVAEYWHTCNIGERLSARGLYFLLVNERIAYVGISREIPSRIETHSKEKLFDAVSIIPLSWDNHALESPESVYINWLRPWFNVKYPSPCKELDVAVDGLIASHGCPEKYMYRGTDSMDVVRLANSVRINTLRPQHLAARTPVWNPEVERLDSEFCRILEESYLD